MSKNINYLEFFCTRHFSILPYLFIHWAICIRMNLWIIILYLELAWQASLFILWLKIFLFGQLECFQLSFWCYVWFFVFSISWLFITRCLRIVICISCHSYFSKEAWLPSVESSLRNYDWDDYSLLLGTIPSKRSCWQKRKTMHAITHLYTCICKIFHM